MHTLAIFTTVADTASGAVASVEEFLGAYQDTVYDWYAIGADSRWDDTLGVDAEGRPRTALSAAEDPALFWSVVDRAVASRDDQFRRLAGLVTGAPVGVGDLAPEEARDDPAGVAARRSAHNAEAAAELAAALAAPAPGEQHVLAGIRLARLGELLAGQFGSESYYYDVESYSGDAEPVRERVAHDPARQWVVAVDLHS